MEKRSLRYSKRLYYFIKVVCLRSAVTVTYIDVVSCFILRFKFDLDTFPTRVYYYSSQIIRSVPTANTVLYVLKDPER